MPLYAVTDTVTAIVKRWGYTDFTLNSSWDAGTETQTEMSPPDQQIPADDPNWYWKVSGASFVATDDTERLPYRKVEKMGEIDKQSGRLLAQGFEYPAASGNIFSSSERAQLNYESLDRAADASDFPLDHSFADNSGMYTIADVTDMHAFFAAWKTRKYDVLTAGTQLKDDCRDAADQAALDAVVDSRT